MTVRDIEEATISDTHLQNLKTCNRRLAIQHGRHKTEHMTILDNQR